METLLYNNHCYNQLLIHFSQWSHTSQTSMKVLDFQKHSANIRNSLIQQRKLLLYFLIHQKKRVTFIEYSWNNHGIFVYSIFPEHYFRIFPRISLEIFSEYTGNISRECSSNILQTYLYPVGNGLVRKINAFVKSSKFDVWHDPCITFALTHAE